MRGAARVPQDTEILPPWLTPNPFLLGRSLRARGEAGGRAGQERLTAPSSLSRLSFPSGLKRKSLDWAGLAGLVLATLKGQSWLQGRCAWWVSDANRGQSHTTRTQEISKAEEQSVKSHARTEGPAKAPRWASARGEAVTASRASPPSAEAAE